MKKFLIFISIVATFISCSDVEDVTYNDSKAFVAFSEPVYNLRVPENSQISMDVQFLASNKVDYERTYQLTILESETDANPATYVIPSSITIPANSLVGVISVVGIDGGLVDSQVKKLTLKVTGYAENESTDLDKLVINIFEFCPIVVDEFIGDFSSTTFIQQGFAVNVVSEGTAPNTLVIENIFGGNDPNFVFTYDPQDNNNITFATRYTGVNAQQGPIWARMSTVNTSNVDACTGKIGIWINYYIPNVGSFGDQYEVFTKL